MRRDHLAFVAYLEDRARGWAFGYGPEPRTHDCARYVAGGVLAATGKDPLSRFVGRWTTETGAARVLARHGGMAAAVGSVLREISPTLAQRADVGMTADGALVLFEGETLRGVAADGDVILPRAHAVRAWSAD